MSGFSIDTSEIRAYAADMTKVPDVLAKDVRGVVIKGAVNIKNQQRAAMAASKHFKGNARTINFDMYGDMVFGVGIIEATIGPEKKYGKKSGGGNASNIAYFGTSRGGGTVEDPQVALDAEAPKFNSALEKLMGNLL